MTRDQNMRDREDTITLADEPVIVDAFEKELHISSPEPESMTEGQNATEKQAGEKDSEKEQPQHCDCCRHNAAPTMAQLAFAFAGLGRGFGRRGGGGKGFGGGPGGKHGGGGGRHHGRFGHHRAYSPPGWEEIKDIPQRRGGRHHEGKGGKFGRGGRCNCEREESGAIKNVDNECLVHGTENIKARGEAGPRMHRRGGRGGPGYKGEGRCVCTRDGEAIEDVADDCVIHGKDGLREVPDERVECYGRMGKIGRGFRSGMPMGMGSEGHRRRGGRFEHGMMAQHFGGGHKMKGGRHGQGHGGFGLSGGPGRHGRHGHGHFRPT